MLKFILSIAGILACALVTYIWLEFSSINIPRLAEFRPTYNEQRFEHMGSWLQNIGENGHFNGTVAVAHKGELLFHHFIGAANATASHKINAHTTFNIASVTKQFTAAAVLMLQAQNKVALDEPITRFLPELKQFNEITIRHLLIGTSGVPDYVAASAEFLPANEWLSNAKVVDWLSTQVPDASFEVGMQYAYSNTAYILLAEIVERASGVPFEVFLTENLFRPAGMDNTTIYRHDSNHAAMKNLATSMKKRFFYFGDFVDIAESKLDGAAGDGNVISSAHDLIKWHTALLNGKIMAKADYAPALEHQSFDDGAPIKENILGKEFYQGLGWNLYTDESGHDSFGSWNGYQNYFYRDEKSDVTIVVLANMAHFIPFMMIVDEIKQEANRWFEL